MPTRYGSPDATNRTLPHRQPPLNRSICVSSPIRRSEYLERSCCGSGSAPCPGLPDRVTRRDEPGLVGQHDRVDAIAGVELAEDALDVCLDGGLAEHELGRELRVRQAARDQGEHFDLAGGERLEL